jgi:adenylate cyclase
MFTEPFDRYGYTKTNAKAPTDSADDLALGDAVNDLSASVITGALSVDGPDDPDERAQSVAKTVASLKDAVLMQPFSNVEGDINKISGSSFAVLPIDPLLKQSYFGFVNDTPSPVDGVRYTLPIVIRVGRQLYPSLSLETLCQILHVDADKVTVRVGKEVVLRNSSGKSWTIPINDLGEMAINYRSSAGFAKSSFKGLFDAFTKFGKFGTPIPSYADIDKKALIIGQDAPGLTDLGPTPLESRAPLVYTHFNVVNDVLRNDYIHFVPLPWVVAGWLIVSWISLFSLRHTLLTMAVTLPSVVIGLYIVAAIALFWIWSVELPMAWPILGYFSIHMILGIRFWRAEAQSKAEVKAVFARMLSPEVMDHILSHPTGLELGGTTRAVTILFSDIRGYTKISENMGNEELVRQLNDYFEEMVECVVRHRGTFHKFIGDAIMAVWGDIASVSAGTEEDARNAVRAALEMRVKLAELNIDRTAKGLLPLRIGIGLNFGEVLAGQIGARRRSEFTVMGDPVNVASRLEGMTKTFHTDLAIGESVHDLIGDEFLARRLGLIVLVGKSKPMTVYEVFRERQDAASSPWTEDDIRQYEEAFDHFLARRFDLAEKGFLACQVRHPDDYCLERYLQAAREFLAAPPPPDWDGRIVMETK